MPGRLRRSCHDLVGQGREYMNLGNCYDAMKQYGKVIEMHEQVREIAEAVGDRTGQGKACGNLGLCYNVMCSTPRHRDARAAASNCGGGGRQTRAGRAAT